MVDRFDIGLAPALRAGLAGDVFIFPEATFTNTKIAACFLPNTTFLLSNSFIIGVIIGGHAKAELLG